MSEEKQSQADRMVQLALGSGTYLFTDQYGAPFIRYDDGRGVLVTQNLKAGAVRDWLAGLLWKAETKAPGGEAVASALSILRAKAREGLTYRLYNRVAPDGEGGVLIDMANDSWNALHIRPGGWAVEAMGPPTFLRHSHMKALPTPVKGGDPLEILKFVNLKEEKHRLLYVVTVISYLVPDIQHVIMLFHGSHGSGKSLSMRAARAVVDPSIVELLNMPNNDRELIQQLFHHYMAFYDNLSTLPDWVSDILCRAVTGAGNTKRALYTDDDDVIYEYRRCAGLNGINIAARRGDLFDRSLIYSCEMLEDEKRAEEKVLMAMMDEAVPRILGGMLDTLVAALNIYPTIQLDKLYRMADFTRWGCAITEALNMDRGLFLEAYEENVQTQSEETLKASVIATVLLNYLENCPDGWRGAPSILYEALCGHAEVLKVSTRQKAWPKTADWMIRRLNEVKPSLYKAGWLVETDRAARSRVVTVRKVSRSDVDGDMVSSPNDTNDAIDTTSKSFPNSDHSLRKDLNRLVNVLGELEKESGEAVSADALIGRLMWYREYFDKIIQVAMRDGMIFSPRPGYYRRASP